MKGSPISHLKSVTREQLLGNYGKLSSYVLLYMLFGMVINHLSGMIYGEDAITPILADLIAGLLSSIFTVGFLNVCMRFVREKEISIADFFYVFRHDPDKVIIISFILWFFRRLIYIPVELSGVLKLSGDRSPGRILIVCLSVALLAALYVYVLIMLSQAYLMYIDDPSLDARQIIAGSLNMMNSNKLRYFRLLISVFFMYCLTFITMGLGSFWMLPYMYGLMINFYEDISKFDHQSQ